MSANVDIEKNWPTYHYEVNLMICKSSGIFKAEDDKEAYKIGHENKASLLYREDENGCYKFLIGRFQ